MLVPNNSAISQSVHFNAKVCGEVIAGSSIGLIARFEMFVKPRFGMAWLTFWLLLFAWDPNLSGYGTLCQTLGYIAVQSNLVQSSGPHCLPKYLQNDSPPNFTKIIWNIELLVVEKPDREVHTFHVWLYKLVSLFHRLMIVDFMNFVSVFR